MKWIDVVTQRSLGTSTTAVELSGDKSGNAADYVMPDSARTLLAVRPKYLQVTPTAHESEIATLRLASTDILSIGDFEVFANPIGASLGTNISGFLDSSRWYPANIPVKGGNHLQVFGQSQQAATAAPYLGADLLLTDGGPDGPQYHYKVDSVNNGSGVTTMAAATAGTTSGKNININNGKSLVALYGIVTNTTPAAVKPISGYFQFDSADLGIHPLNLTVEPVQGFLGTTTTEDQVHLSVVENIDVSMKSTVSISYLFNLQLAITTAGVFQGGLAYTS